MKKLFVVLTSLMLFSVLPQSVAAQSEPELVFIKLRLSSGSSSYSTDVYFNDLASQGFDLGFDAQFVFGLPDFVIYSTLADGSNVEPYSLQAVNTLDLIDITLPLGINASGSQPITLALVINQLPPTTEVYLDDTLLNTSTLLTAGNYQFTPTGPLSGTGRFFLRISDDTLQSTYTYNDGVWSPEDPSGIGTVFDDLIVESGDAVISEATTFNKITVNPGAGLIAGGILSVTDAIYLESTSTSFSSYVHPGVSNTADIVYERFVNSNSNGNDLIAKPTSNDIAFDDFLNTASNSSDLLDDGNIGPTTYAFAPFVKTTGTYQNFNTDNTDATIVAGKGYRVATDAGATLVFEGGSNNNTVAVDIENSGPIRQEWNLVGNPYPSYLSVQNFLLHEVAPGVRNFQLFDPNTAAIYGYDGIAEDGWTILNLANSLPSTRIAPGQGFFISANQTTAVANDLEFTGDMRATGNSDDFIPGRFSELQFLKLNLSTSNKSYHTEFYFNPSASSGFDIGYDAEVWGNTVPDFGIYSRLVENDLGQAIALQTLNSSAFSDLSIPLGVHANQGEQLRFSITDLNLPGNVRVYLDDVTSNTSTLLNDSDYIIVPTTDLSGIGRFFLRFSEDTLGTSEENLENLTIRVDRTNKSLVVSGQLNAQTNLQIFDIQGRQVIQKSLDVDRIQNRIDLANVNSGIYLVTLQNQNQKLNKKVLID